MNQELQQKILSLLDEHRIMTIATLRPDGWPQATTVGYAHEGTTLYFLCGPESQKAANLAKDDRVSVTIDHDTNEIMKIEGLSMAAHAKRVKDPAEVTRIMGLLFNRYGRQMSGDFPVTVPPPSDVAVFRVTPEVVSVLDYSKGFGHTDLVAC